MFFVWVICYVFFVVFGGYGDLKKVLDLLELEFCIDRNCYVGCWELNKSFVKNICL